MFLTNVNRYRTSNVKGVTKKPATDSIERISTVNRQSELPPPTPIKHLIFDLNCLRARTVPTTRGVLA